MYFLINSKLDFHVPRLTQENLTDPQLQKSKMAALDIISSDSSRTYCVLGRLYYSCPIKSDMHTAQLLSAEMFQLSLDAQNTGDIN